MFRFFNKNNLNEKDLNERGNADKELETESEDVKYVYFDCLNFE